MTQLLVVLVVVAILFIYVQVKDDNSKPTTIPKKVKLKSSSLEYNIAGINFRKGIEYYVCNNWEEAYDAMLIPEPTNEYDRNAIRVEIAQDGHHVGYVSKSDQQEIREMCSTFPHKCQVHIKACNDQYKGTYYVGTIIL